MTVVNPARRQRVFAILVLVWMAIVATIYYKRGWQILILGPVEWIRDNPSLAYPASALRALVDSGFSAWEFPYFTDALSRAIISLFSAGMILIAAQTLGWCVCEAMRCQFMNWIEKMVYRLGIGFGVLAYLSLGMAALGIYRPTFVRTLVWVAAVSGMLLLSIHLLRKQEWKPFPAIRRITIWQGIALLAVLVALIGALAPEVEYDALWYHLWLPRIWLEHGSPVDVVEEYISLYPMTWELVYGAGLSMGGPVVAKLLNFICLVLSGMVIYQLMRRYFPRAPAWVAVAIWITTPTVLWEATTAYNDLALGFFILLTIYAALRFTEAREGQWLILAGLNAGIALGTKHLALWMLVLILVGLGLKLWLATRKLKAAIFPVLTLATIGLAMALPWYWRSWRASGNPVFPDLYNVFGAKPPQRWDAITEEGLDGFKAHFGRPRSVLGMVELPWDMTIHAAYYGGDLGPIFLIFVPVLVLYRNRASLVFWLGCFVFLYILFWASPLSSFQMRFLVPIVPLLAVLAAEGVERARIALRESTGKTSKYLLDAGIITLCLLNLPPFTSLHEFDRLGWDGWLTHVIHTVPLGVVSGKQAEEDYLEQKVPSYAAWQYIDTHLAEDSRILVFGGGDQFYSHRRRIPSDATIARQAVWLPQRGDDSRLLAQMSALGITHILFEKRKLMDLAAHNLAIAQPEVINKWYSTEYEDSNFILFRLMQR